MVARSPADGYTLLLRAGTITMNHSSTRSCRMTCCATWRRDADGLGAERAGGAPSQPMKTLADYIAAAKAAPGKINYARPASAAIFTWRWSSQVPHRHRRGARSYKGVGPAMPDTLAGHVMSMVSNVASAKPHVEAGKLRALAVTSLPRAPALPDVPSIQRPASRTTRCSTGSGCLRPRARRRRSSTACRPRPRDVRGSETQRASPARAPSRSPASPRSSPRS